MEKDTEIKTVGKKKEIKEDKQRKAAEAGLKKPEESPSKLSRSEEAKPLATSPKSQSKEEVMAKPQEKKEETKAKEKIERKIEESLPKKDYPISSSQKGKKNGQSKEEKK